LDHVWNTSVEQALAEIPADSLDCIVAADVLEHLVDPWSVLAELRHRLVPEGIIVASIPNIGHWQVISELLEGTWQYTGEGLLDRTHLRFFTRRSIRELFWTAGLAIREMTPICRTPGDVPSPVVSALQKSGLRVGGILEEAQAFQYRVVAQRVAPPRTWPRLGIALWNPSESADTLECLASLHQLDYSPVDIVLINTGSAPATLATIRARFPEVRFLQSDRDLSSAGAKNLGIQSLFERGAEYVFLLDSRTTVDRAFLTRLVDAALLAPEAGLWGPRICYHSDPETVWAAGLRWDLSRLSFVAQGEGDSVTATDTVHTVDALIGCAMLIRRDVYERVGNFFEGYRSQWEDIDFCTRAVDMGYTCLLVPTSLIRYKLAPATQQPSRLTEYFETRDQLLWGRRHLKSRHTPSLRRHILRGLWQMLPRKPKWTAGPRKLYWWGWAAIRESRNPLFRAKLRALVNDVLQRTP
jgi:hypothetical protein